MASVNIKPLEDKILVQAVEAETTTASGLVIPDTAKEKPQEGKVIAVGPGRWDDEGENRIPVDVKEGDTVIYSKVRRHRDQVLGRGIPDPVGTRRAGRDRLRTRRSGDRSVPRHRPHRPGARTGPGARLSAPLSRQRITHTGSITRADPHNRKHPPWPSTSIRRHSSPGTRTRHQRPRRHCQGHPRTPRSARRARKSLRRTTVTNDGVTIARDIDLDDPSENLGAQLVKSVATKTNDVAGDGTTTATVLAQAIVTAGLRNVTAGANPIALGAGIGKAADAISTELLRVATPVDGETAIAQVATVSSRDEEVGTMVGKAMSTVGADGVVTVEEGSGLQTELNITEGVQFDRATSRPTSSPTTTAREAILEDALVLLYRDKISSCPTSCRCSRRSSRPVNRC